MAGCDCLPLQYACTGSQGSFLSLSPPVLVTLSPRAGGIRICPKKMLPISKAALLQAGGCHGNVVL